MNPRLFALALPLLLGAVQEDDPREKRRRAVAVGDRLLRVVREDLRQPDPSDPAAQAAALGFDPDRIFAFVRDEVATEPYRGVLRGARGALVARAGNSWDKALLLQKMLEASGRRARLVHAKLPEARAEELVRRFLAREPYRHAEKPPDWDAAAARIGFEPALVRETVRRGIDEDLRIRAEAWDLAAREAEALRVHLKGLPLGRSRADWAKELTSRVVDHAWLQLDGKDLDAAFAASKPGERHAGAPAEARRLERHRVDFTLQFKYSLDGQAKEEPILEIPIYADEALFEPALFAISPAEELPPISKMSGMKPEEVVDRFRKIRRFQAMLRIGARQHASRPFDLDGKLYDVSDGGDIAMMKKFGETIGDMFSFEPKKTPATKFLELSVHLRFDGPGVSRPRQKRVILRDSDLEGPHVQTPMLAWDILLQPHLFSEDFVAHEFLRHTLATWEPFLDVLRKDELNADEADRYSRRTPRPWPAFLVRFAMQRQAAMARLLAETPGVTLLWDSPNLYIAEQRRCISREKAEICARARVDIVDNRVSFVPTDDKSDAAGLAVRQGAFDTVVEALLLQSETPVVKARSPAAAFERARILGTEWVVGSPKEFEGWIRSCEEPGRIIVAPKGESAWWTVDPQTGVVLGRDEGGGGQAMSEYKVLLAFAGFLWCIGDLAYDATKGDQHPGKMVPRMLLKITRCLVLYGLSVTGTGTFAARFVGGAIAGMLINYLFGGAGLLGAGWGALSGIF